MIVAFCALVVFPPVDGAAATAVDSKAYSIISAFIAKMPLGLAFFMVIGIIAAQMSTIDTFVNVAALHVSYDLIDPLLLKNAPEKTRLHVGRLVSVLVIVVGLCLAFISESLGDIYYVSSGVLSASIAVPLFFIFWKRTTHAAVLVASATGFFGTVGGYWYEYKFLNGVDPAAPTYYAKLLPVWLQGSYCYNYLAFGVLLSLIAIVAVSLATKPSAAANLRFVSAEPVDEIDAFKAVCRIS
jgi:SSS family solute:Na+ symporter